MAPILRPRNNVGRVLPIHKSAPASISSLRRTDSDSRLSGQPVLCSTILPYEIWTRAISLLCYIPKSVVVEGGFGYEQDRELMKEERCRLRSVCSLFMHVIRDLERCEVHVELPQFCDNERWLQHLNRSPRNCVRWSLSDLCLTVNKCSEIDRVWQTTTALRRLDIDVGMEGHWDGSQRVVHDEASRALLAAVHKLLIANNNTLTTMRWSTSTVDAFHVIRTAHSHISNLTMCASHQSRTAQWVQSFTPLHWSNLRYLQIFDTFEPSAPQSHVLDVFCSDSIANLSELVVFTRSCLPGVQSILERNPSITKLSLEIKRLEEGERIPDGGAVRELHASVHVLLAFLRSVRPHLESIYVASSQPPSIRNPTGITHRIAIVLELIANTYDPSRSPKLKEVVFTECTSRILTNTPWNYEDVELVVDAAKTLRATKVTAKTSDGKSIFSLRRRFNILHD